MSANPYSIMKQILLFDEVEKARLEFKDYEIWHIIKLRNGVDAAKVTEELRQYIEEHRGLCSCHIVSLEWSDGPDLPERYKLLDDYELRLVELCSGTTGDISAAIGQAYSWLSDVQVETIGAGHVGITLYPKENKIVTETEINHCTLLGELLVSAPGVKITVSVNYGERVNNDDYANDSLNSQASKAKIQDKALKKLFDVDEDLFREVARKQYLVNLPSLIPILDFQGSSILLPNIYDAINIKGLLPLYERVYIPLPFKEMEPETIFGAHRYEILSLIEMGRVVPVVCQNYGRYSERTIKEFTMLKKFISPRQLTIALANDFLNRNPLWSIAQKDFSLAKAIIRDINVAASSYWGNKEENQTTRAIKRWSDFQTEAIVSFDSLMLNMGSLSALYIGPGALLNKVFVEELSDNNAPSLEVLFSGMEIMQSAALKAVCLPSMNQAIRLYDVLASLYSYKKTHPADQLRISNKLDKILENIKITCPQDVSVIDWAQALNSQEIRRLREVVGKVCNNCNIDDVLEIQKHAIRLGELTDIYVQRSSSIEKVVERLDILGFTVEAIIMKNEWSIPFAGWFIGTTLKNTIPKLWDQMSHNPLLAEAQNMISSMGTLSDINAVRLHRVRQSILERLEKTH